MFKVMIVDDMEITRIEIKRLGVWGDKTGFRIVEEAENGFEALEKIKKAPVDLIITDVKMPKIDGIELLKKIMESNLCSCVVLLSDYSDFDYVRQGLVLGAFDYLRKPVKEQEFIKLLHRAGEHIMRKQEEQDRLRKLEGLLGENINTFYPKIEIDQLIEYICNKDTRVNDTCERIVYVLGNNLNYDLIQTGSLLKNALYDVTEGVSQIYPWINKFVNISEIKNTNFSACNTFDLIKNLFIKVVTGLTSVINTLYCGTKEESIICQVCDYALNNIDGDISLKAVADIVCMNKTYLSEMFKRKAGISFIEYITTVKMERAKNMLEYESMKIYEVADQLRFKDIEYFSRVFKKYTGISPTEYKHLH